MQRKHLVATMMIVAAVLAAAPAFAGDPAADYVAGAGTKLGRGVANGAAGWVEVPKQTVIGGQDGGATGVVGGFFKGIGLGAVRTVAGAYEIATFWAPVPPRFEPVMKPATAFEGR